MYKGTAMQLLSISLALSPFIITAFPLRNLEHVLGTCFQDDLVTQLHQLQQGIQIVRNHNVRTGRDVRHPKLQSLHTTRAEWKRLKLWLSGSIVSANTGSSFSSFYAACGILGQTASSFLNIGIGIPKPSF